MLVPSKDGLRPSRKSERFPRLAQKPSLIASGQQGLYFQMYTYMCISIDLSVYLSIYFSYVHTSIYMMYMHVYMYND